MTLRVTLLMGGIGGAKMAQEAINAVKRDDVIPDGPSNPVLSIGPILATTGLRALIVESPIPKIGVSPLITGRAVKGPAADMMRPIGKRADVLGVAEVYAGLLDHIVIDDQDRALGADFTRMTIHFDHIMMQTTADKMAVAPRDLDMLQHKKAA